MPCKKNQPGHPCCDACEWAGGRFDQSAYLDVDWQEPNRSDWEITGGVLRTDAESSVLLHSSAYDDREGPERHRLEVTLEAETAGRTVLAIVAAEDDENYIALELTIGDGTDQVLGKARLIDVTAGVATAISQVHYFRGVVAGTRYTLQVDFDEGLVRGVVATSRNEPQSAGEPSSGTWQRELRSAGVSTTYHGDYAGVGVAGGTGDVDVSFWQAGCVELREFCELEYDTLTYTSAAWKQTAWEKISGTWPTRATDLGGSIVGVDATAAVMLLHRNPILDTWADDHAAVAQFGSVGGLFAAGDMFRLMLASDASGQNAVAASLEIVDGTKFRAKLEALVAGSWSTLTSSLVNRVGDPVEGYEIKACWQRYTLQATIGTGGNVAELARVSTAAGGAFCGVDMTPSSGSTIRLTNFATYRHGPINPDVNQWHADCVTCRGDCEYCLDNDWPNEGLIEFPETWTPSGSTYSDCDCDALGGPLYAQYNPVATGRSCSLYGTAKLYDGVPPAPTAGYTGCTGVALWRVDYGYGGILPLSIRNYLAAHWTGYNASKYYIVATFSMALNANGTPRAFGAYWAREIDYNYPAEAKPTCMDWNRLELTLFGDYSHPTQQVCIPSGNAFLTVV